MTRAVVNSTSADRIKNVRREAYKKVE